MPFLPTVEGRALELSSVALRVHRFSRRKSTRLLLLLAAAAPLVTTAPAATYIWDGNFGFGNSRWSTGANWSNNVAPTGNLISGLTTANVVFAGNNKLTSTISSTYFLRSITFDLSAGAFNIVPQNTETIRLGAGGIINNSTNKQSFYTSMVLSNAQAWVAVAGNLDFRNNIYLGANPLTLAGSAGISLSNSIQGTGALLKQGSGTLILAGTSANTFSGGMTIQAGTVTVAKSDALGTGPLVLSGGVLNVGNFTLGVSSISLQGGVINSGSGGLSSSSAYQLQSGTVNSRLGGTGGLQKTTGGVVTLTAANTYTGGTQITGGQLVVNNLTGSGTGTGNVSISSGGLLVGTGAVSGMVTNAPGGSISAGNEIGVLNLGSTVWFGGATNRWDLSDAAGSAGTGWDLLNINGTLTLNAAATDQALIDITSFTLGGTPGATANFDASQSYLWTIAQTTGGIFFAPGESELTVFDLLTGNFINPLNGGTFGVSLSPDGRQLNVSYTPIPEPSALGLLGLGLFGLIYIRRFKQNWGSPQR